MMKRMMTVMLACALLVTAAHAQEIYYVNPDGGRYIHESRHCDAMSEKYWPTLQEITLEEAARRGLMRCQRCQSTQEEPVFMESQMLTAEHAQATSGESQVYTLGGSEADVIHDVTAMPDGGALLAGFTRSHDGTLSDRTMQGWTGWLCRVDAAGHVLWNFCSRRGSDDRMRAPVVHADGSITVLLDGNGNERNLIELILLNPQGEVISRRTIVELSNAQGNCMIEEPGVFAGGYVIAGADVEANLRSITYRWFDFEGKPIKTVKGQWDRAVMAVSSGHIIEVHDGAYWLCSLDEQGNDTRLCRLFESDGRDSLTRMTFTSLATLDDGGALACMHQGMEAQRMGRLIRFGADGSVVWQLDLGSFSPDDVCAVPGGFAMTGEAMEGTYQLIWGDGDGQVLRRHDLDRVYEFNASHSLAILTDGRAAYAGAAQGPKGKGDFVNYDVQLHMVR